MKFTLKYIKLTTSKHRKKFYVLKFSCKVGLYDVYVPPKTDDFIYEFFCHFETKIFLDKKSYEKFITSHKRYSDWRYTHQYKKSFGSEIYKQIDFRLVRANNKNVIFDDYLYLPFKTKSEYLKFKLRTQ